MTQPPSCSETAQLRDALAAMGQFATVNDTGHWIGWFAEATDQLSSRSPVTPYYPDLLPDLGPEHARLTAGLVKSWVFGGMGSWNDIWFGEPGVQASYERVTGDLYSAVMVAVDAATNARRSVVSTIVRGVREAPVHLAACGCDCAITSCRGNPHAQRVTHLDGSRVDNEHEVVARQARARDHLDRKHSTGDTGIRVERVTSADLPGLDPAFEQRMLGHGPRIYQALVPPADESRNDPSKSPRAVPASPKNVTMPAHWPSGIVR